MFVILRRTDEVRRRISTLASTTQASPAKPIYRFVNWNLFLAPFCPYFLRSFIRESRVKNPLVRNDGRSSGLNREIARDNPMRTAPA
jgi:hypothetical protein